MVLHQCQNCGTYYDLDQIKPVADLTQRVAPGEPMPSGECPDQDCGAVCHPEELTLQQVVEIVVERLEGDVFFDPGNEDERQMLNYATQGLKWLRRAVEA